MKKSCVALMVLIGIIVGVGVVGAATAVASNGTKTAAAPPAGGESGAVAIAWNQELLHIVQTPGAQPASLHPTRSFAILRPRFTTRSFRSPRTTVLTSSRSRQPEGHAWMLPPRRRGTTCL